MRASLEKNKEHNGQRGITISGFMLLCAIAIIALTSVMRVGPAYFEYYKIEKTLVAVAGEVNGSGEKGTSRIQSDIAKRFDIDQVKELTAGDIVIERDGASVTLSAEYDTCRPLFYNMRVCMTFNPSSVLKTAAE